MNKKNFHVSVIVSMILLLILISNSIREFFDVPIKRYSWKQELQISIYTFIFGILMAWKEIESIIFERKFGVNRTLLFAIPLVIIAFIPSGVWVLNFGIGYYLDLFYGRVTGTIISILAGITIIRSFIKK